MKNIKLGIETVIITQDSGKSPHFDYKSTKRVYTAPEIDYIDGEDYVLKNGNRFPQKKYDEIWKPVKGVIKSSSEARKDDYLNKFTKNIL